MMSLLKISAFFFYLDAFELECPLSLTHIRIFVLLQVPRSRSRARWYGHGVLQYCRWVHRIAPRRQHCKCLQRQDPKRLLLLPRNLHGSGGRLRLFSAKYQHSSSRRPFILPNGPMHLYTHLPYGCGLCLCRPGLPA